MSAPTHRQQRLRIGLIDFEPLRVAGFETVLGNNTDGEVAPTDAAGAMAGDEFGLVILGLQNPSETFELLARLKAARPKLKLVVMGAETDEEIIINAIAAGAKGYLEETATPEQLTQCIDVVESGSIWAPRRVLSV